MGYSLTDEGDWRNMIPHLIDGEDAIADHFSLRGDKVWEDKTWTITQHQAVTNIERLDSKEERGREGERKREGYVICTIMHFY